MSDYSKEFVEQIDIKKEPIGEVRDVETNPASAALAAVTEAQKPSMWSPGMLKLWFILGIGKRIMLHTYSTILLTRRRLPVVHHERF